MRKVILYSLVLLSGACGGNRALLEVPTATGAAMPARTVVLLHGYGRRSGSLGEIAKHLLASGFHVCKVDYSSLRLGPPEILDQLREDFTHCGADNQPLDFVTHSFGGILVRAYAKDAAPGAVGRVVMLAPPNHGSELSDLISSSRLFGFFAGPVVAELGTGPASLPNRLGVADFDVGIIAGSKSVHPIGSFIIDGPNDGTVAVASARLAGMSDFAVTRRAHSFIMNAPEVIAEVTAFLQNGCFSGRFDEVTYEDHGQCGGRRSD